MPKPVPAPDSSRPLLQYLDIDPRPVERVVFRYLRRDDGPHRLRAVKNKALIACTSRSGSTLLAACLERYGLDAQEFFNPEEQVKQAVYAGDAATLRDYANHLADTAVRNGWFIAKGALATFYFLFYLRELPEQTARWKIVYLRRRNIIRQAVSMEIAARTQQWNVRQPVLGVVRPGDYSFDTLLKHLEYIVSAHAAWQRIFAYLGMDPCWVFFEDLVADTNGEAERIARHLGIDLRRFPRARAHTPWPRPQSTALNENWENRFRRELAKRIAGGAASEPGDTGAG
jgi:LPS sulfotransferase NodH